MAQKQVGANNAGGKSKKKGRNKVWCDLYRKRGQREKNKRVKIQRHIKKFPNDLQAQKALKGV